MSDYIFKTISIRDSSFNVVTSARLLDMVEHERTGWRLTEELDVYISYLDGGVWDSQHFTIPAGYPWDGASIPKLFRRIIGDPLDPEFCLPSLIHDFLYDKRYNRFLTDNIFFKLLEATKFKDIPRWKEYAMYKAVRLGGQAHYAITSNPKSLMDKVGKVGWKVIKSVL